MSSSNPYNKIDYSSFGGSPIKSNEDEKIDYSQFGGKPEKEKAGKLASVGYGALEGVLGIPALVQYGVNEWSKGVEKGLGQEPSNLSPEVENPIGSYLSTFPESKDETSRRLRVGTSGAISGAPFGILGIIAGLVGSQAGQTIRELFGKEGKFEEFGWGEGTAIGADILTGGASAVATNLLRSGGRAATQAASNVPAIFERGENLLQRASAKSAIQGEKSALDNIVNNFSQQQISGFESQASQLSPNRYTTLTDSSSSALKRHADQMFRNTQLSIISPLAVTPEQGASAIQQAANQTFQDTVIVAEKQAYAAARDAAEGITGTAPRTLAEAKKLLSDLTKNPPTPEQQPVVNFLRETIEALETSTPGTNTPASTLLDASGRPLIPASSTEATNSATKRSANDLVDLIQRSNSAVNYESELRQQSHRLKPLLNTMRQEVGQVLEKRPEAARLYQEANNLHGQNADIWGTRYMRNVRFAENPETLIGKTKLASNMRNLKQGIQDPTIQGIMERLVVENMTEGGSSSANRNAIRKLSPELSVNANNAAEQLIQVKDPLTTSGGRAAVRNDILKDAAMSVNTGKRPEKILDLMQTPKGYQIVRESMQATPNSRELFQSFERLFVEDIFSSITDKSGMIDFTKAKNIFKNSDVRNVVQQIGGDQLVQRFSQLEMYANNFERNLGLYKKPETITMFQKMFKGVKNASVVGAVMHALHLPIPIIAGLGLAKTVGSAGKTGINAIKDKILSNPKAMRILEQISLSDTTAKLAQQLPRLLLLIDSESDEE